jgi:1,4-alpha-glucan branching enzyme
LAAAVLVAAAAGAVFMRGAADSPPSAVASDAMIAPAADYSATVADREAGDRVVAREFAIETDNARQVSLVGDFNQWNPDRHRLHRDGQSARWFITVRLRTGLHKYAFIVDDSVWTPDPSAIRTVDRDFGVSSSLVLVQ